MELSPNGSKILTGEQLPGEYEGSATWATSLWDVQARQSRPLPDGVSVYGVFSPDSQTIAVTDDGSDGYTSAVKLFDGAARRSCICSICQPESC
jgi:hypothetical protein